MKAYIQITSDAGVTYHGEVVLQKQQTKGKHAVKDSPAKAAGHKCPDIIAMLWREGHFKQALSVAGIKKALDTTGHSFTSENISMVLSRMKFLTRHGKRGSFTWKQKYPHH